MKAWRQFLFPFLVLLLLSASIHSQDRFFRVKRVVDGDTLVAMGKKASAFTKSLVDSKEVRLEYDQANSHIGHRDKYGRILAYVYLKNGTFLNAEIIKQGYGFAYTRFPFKYMKEFRRYEREARENMRGLWGE